jgi:hypothetical protein
MQVSNNLPFGRHSLPGSDNGVKRHAAVCVSASVTGQAKAKLRQTSVHPETSG